MFCPKCGYEYREGFRKCSDCGTDLVTDLPPIKGDEEQGKPLVPLYSPNDELELAMLRGLLDTDGVRYFVLNDYFGSMRVGPKVDLVNKKTIMVAPEDSDRAKEIISNFLLCSEEEKDKCQYSFSQKLRMTMEALLFTWFIPGRKRRKISR
jgi:hypothetical protein